MIPGEVNKGCHVRYAYVANGNQPLNVWHLCGIPLHRGILEALKPEYCILSDISYSVERWEFHFLLFCIDNMFM